jgi:hypothetical protein
LVSTTPVSGSASLKCLGGIHGILAEHRVDHEQGFDRVHRGVQRLDLGHHRVVDAECGRRYRRRARRESLALRVVDRGLAMSSGFCDASDEGKKIADLPGQRLQLLDRGRTVDVALTTSTFFFDAP